MYFQWRRNTVGKEKCQAFFLGKTNRQFNNTLSLSEIRRSFCFVVSTDATLIAVSQHTQIRGNEETYLEEYRQCLSDGKLSSAEIRLLKKLAITLGISEERAKELEASCKPVQLTDSEKQYLEEFKVCLEDGPEISASTRRLLNRLASFLKLTEDQVNRLEKMQ